MSKGAAGNIITVAAGIFSVCAVATHPYSVPAVGVIGLAAAVARSKGFGDLGHVMLFSAGVLIAGLFYGAFIWIHQEALFDSWTSSRSFSRSQPAIINRGSRPPLKNLPVAGCGGI